MRFSTTKKQEESGLKKQVRDYLRYLHWYVVTIQGSPFGTKGVSDLIAMRDRRVLFLEIKTETGKLSDHQKEFARNVHEQGGEYYIVRDLDDLMASFLEVLTANGKYYWIPFERVESAQFHPSADPMDLLWRRTLLSVRGGPDGEVYIPVLYPASHRSADDKVRLGRVTQWQGGDGSPVSGLGQRVLLAGEKDMAILDLKSIEITGPVQGGA